MVTIEPMERSKPPEESTIIWPMAKIARGAVRLRNAMMPFMDE